MSQKANKIIFWITTLFIVISEGIIPALTFRTQLAREGISHLGYPDYFRTLLTVFKVTGALILILPFFKGRIKEWAYAGFAFVFIGGFASHAFIGSGVGFLILPIVMLGIMFLSYFLGKKIESEKL